MNVDIAIHTENLHGLTADRVRSFALSVLEALDAADDAELSILLTDDEEIHRLNRLWRGVDRPTDVLAFPMQEGGEAAGVLGDVVLSLDTVARQARDQGHSTQAEFLFLLIHGILPLLGYDHQTPEEATAMDTLTQRIWQELL